MICQEDFTIMSSWFTSKSKTNILLLSTIILRSKISLLSKNYNYVHQLKLVILWYQILFSKVAWLLFLYKMIHWRRYWTGNLFMTTQLMILKKKLWTQRSCHLIMEMEVRNVMKNKIINQLLWEHKLLKKLLKELEDIWLNSQKH